MKKVLFSFGLLGLLLLSVQSFAQTTYTKITSSSGLEVGAHYLIVGHHETLGVLAMGYQKTNNRKAVVVSENSDAITVTPGTEPDSETDVFQFTLGGGTGAWTFFDEVKEGYLYAASSTGNQLKTQTTLDANGQWSITFNSDGTAEVVAQGENTRNNMRFNPNISNGDPLFSCYLESSNVDTRVSFYKAGGTSEPDHAFVDLGLPSGLLWATCNVGATNPEDYGDYFAWGETQPKDYYDWSTYQYCMGSYNTLTKYCSNSSYGYNGFTDSLTTLLPEDDAATAIWGGNWRMPTKEEFEELYNNTTVSWTTQNGVDGRLFVAANGNTLFLPATGYRWNGELYYSGSRGNYWSSSLYTTTPAPDIACQLFFTVNSNCGIDGDSRDGGQPVRPVWSGQSASFIINATASPEEGGTVEGAGTYAEGETCILMATPAEGYVFLNWKENDVIVSTDATYSFTVTGNRNLVANFVLEDFCGIVFDLYDSYGDGWNGASLIVSFDDGTESQSLTVPSGYSASYTLEIGDDTHVTLTWSSGDYDSECSFTVSYEGELVIYQSSGTPSTGVIYQFDCNCEAASQTFTVTVTSSNMEYGTVQGGGEFSYGQTCTVTATPANGYMFASWTQNGEVVSGYASYTFNVTSDMDLVANFVQIPYERYFITATANPTEGGTVSLGGETLIFEPFDEYTEGNKIASSAITAGLDWWTTWSNAPGGTEDGEVAVFNSTKCGHFTYGNDQVFLLGDEDNGIYDLEFDIFVPQGKNGYFNILHDFAGASSTWAMQCYLHMTDYGGGSSTSDPGHGTVHAGSNGTADLPCVYDQWMHFRVRVDADNDVARLYFNVIGQAEELYAEWQWSLDSYGENVVGHTLSAMNFYPPMNTSEFYLDNISFKKMNGESAPVFSITPTTIEETLGEDDMTSVPVTIHNSGNSVGDWLGWLDFGQGGAGSQNTDLYYHNGEVASGIGSSDAYTREMGIRLPATAYAGAAMGMRITSAQYYVYDEYQSADHNYIFRIYGQGLHNQPGELLAEKTVNSTVAGQWITAVFDEPVYMTGQAMWATVQLEQVAGEYPLSMDGGEYGEESDGNWLSTNGRIFSHCYSSGSLTGAWLITIHCEGELIPATWATIDKTESSILMGQSDVVTLTLNSIGLQQGIYNANFIINTDDEDMAYVEIPVTLNVGNGKSIDKRGSSTPLLTADNITNNKSGSVRISGFFDADATCTLTATPAEGYTFVNWTKDNVEVSTEAVYSFTVTEDAAYVANFVLDQGEVTQETSFSQGWNWWNTYVEQAGMDGLSQLEESLGDNGITIRSQVGYTDYYAGYGWYGSLASIDNESSYKIKANAPCSVALTGVEAVPSQHPITLDQGWTWMGYVSSIAMDVNEALSGLEATVGDKLKSQEGYADYYANYGWYGSLSTIEPGMGLMYYSANSEAVTFTYPDGSKGGTKKRNLTAENNHWVPNPHAYPTNMTVSAVIDLDGEEIQSEDYELAVFDANGECRGSIMTMYVDITSRYYAFLTIYGDIPAELHFGLYDWQTYEECFDVDETIMYDADAMLGSIFDPVVLHFHGMNSVDELDSHIKVFPNPVNRAEQFSLGLTGDMTDLVRVEIINTLGVVETVHAPSLQTFTAPNVAGVYTLRITEEGKETVVRKLVVK